MASIAILAGQPYLQNSVMQLKQKTPAAGELGTETGELFLGGYRLITTVPFFCIRSPLQTERVQAMKLSN